MTPEERKGYDEALRRIETCRLEGGKGTRLDLLGLSLTILPPEIGELSALTGLNLQKNHLTTLPPEIGRLTALARLDVAFNHLTSLPPEIGKLTGLAVLDLSVNQLITLPLEIGQLTRLMVLGLSGNQFTTLPPEIGRLTALWELSIFFNQLTTLPPEIGQLTALTRLGLSSNRLTILPPELRRLKRLERLYLHGNPSLGLAGEALGPDATEVDKDNKVPASPQEILDIYFAQQAGGTKALNEVKVLLVGRGGSGKTSIRKRLIENQFDPDQKETPGIEIDHWKLERSADGIEAHLWDFAGQDITHATHQFFLTKRSLYLLVVEGHRDDSQDRDAEYWLRLIRAFGADSPVILILNKWDANPFPLQEFTLRREFPQIRAILRTDCRTGLGLRELEQVILQTVRSMESVTQPFPKLWFAVKERLAAMKENYLPLCEYRSVCQSHGVTAQTDQDSLAGHLHNLGIILHYADDARLHDTTVLNPRWVTASVYALIRHVERRQKASGKYDGHFTLAEARAALPAEAPDADMVPYLVGLMERFELCYPLEGLTDTWLIPQLLSPQNPQNLGDRWFKEPATRLRYQYNVLPEGLLPRFIVRAHPLVFEGQVWCQGVVLEMDDEASGESARALVIAESNRERIEVTVIGAAAARLRLTKLVRAHFHDIHENFTRTEQRDGKSVQVNTLDARELMELEGQPGLFQSIKTLLVDEREQKISTIATDERGSVRIDQTQELNRVASPEGKERRNTARELFQERPKVFLSYAHADAAYRDVFLQNLEVMEFDGLIDSWHDGKVLASQDFDKEIRTALKEANLIIFLVSTASLRSKYIREVEIPQTLVNRAIYTLLVPRPKVVQILLEQHCAWKGGPFAHFQMLPGDRSGNIKAVDQWPNRRKAFNAVEQSLRKLLKDG